MNTYTVVVTKRFTFNEVKANSREHAKELITTDYVWDSSHADADDIEFYLEAEENDE